MSTSTNRLRARSGSTEGHPRTVEPVVLVLTVGLSVLGAIIGMYLVSTLGISANTSVIGALIAMLAGRVPVAVMKRMRSVHRQNLVQSAISGSTFAAANSLLTPIAVPFALGRPELVWPMLAGSAAGLLIDAWVLYRIFDSRLMPATGAWPPGLAAAETIIAGDRGGRRALILVGGGVVGVVGNLLGLSMSAAGVAFIGNVWALGMFGLGLAITQYVPGLTGIDLDAQYVPHGVMIGAGLVALGQAVWFLAHRDHGGRAAATDATTADGPQTLAAAPVAAGSGAPVPAAGAPTDAATTDAATTDGAGVDPSLEPTVDERRLRSGLLSGYVLFVLGAVMLGLVGGLLADMSAWELLGWVLLAGVAAITHEIIVGLAAMHSGWFPAFAVALIWLIIGLLLGVPTVPLALLVGYTASTGPAFADMGYDLKAGWWLRRDHRPFLAFEWAGRRQQYIAGLIGFTVAIIVVALTWRSFFDQGLVPPVAKVYAASIHAGISDPATVWKLVGWAIPGAAIQLIGGAKRQMGVLLATGLLILSPNACWLVFGALLVRALYTRWRGEEAQTELSLVGAGIIAGDALFGTSKILTR